MSKSNGEGRQPADAGAAYIRVSTDQQDTERQYAAVRAFEKRRGVTIARHHWYEDEGWARDEADRRPDFQRMMRLAESGRVQWIVVDQLDRFGTKDAHQLIHYLHRLRECGCKLYDASGKEWTGEDVATIITAVVEGAKSKGEQTSKSHRVLGGKIERARRGEWQGGPVRLGFDVVCYQRETDAELWRVVFEGLGKRLKVYPDGRAERFDGRDNFPKSQPATEVLRVAPSKDGGKVAAAVSVFKRFAAESISFTALAHHLNALGCRTSYGGYFQSHHVEGMLEDPIYLGYYTYNRRHFGKFHRFTDDRVVPEANYDMKQSKNDKADWVQSRRLFAPLVEMRTWDAVQKKLDAPKRARSPRSAAQYLAGLVYCGNCGARMVTGSLRKTTKHARKDGHTGDRHEYFCGTYAKHCREKRRHQCGCRRNGVFQDVLEKFIDRYLDESGRRLEVLTEGIDVDHLTAKLEGREDGHWREFVLGLERLQTYLRKHHPDEYKALMHDHYNYVEDEPRDGFVEACVEHYRAVFDPSKLTAEVERLEAEHTAMMQRWADLPTPRAKEKARERFGALEARMESLRRQQEDLGGVVAAHYGEMCDLRRAIDDAKRAMEGEAAERALRQRAEALRAIIQRIECTFTKTGETGGGWGKRNARLATVTIYPVVGDSVAFSAESRGTLMYSSAHSRMKRTRVGRMR
jgi:DNA invertase Pin-like site-specific DNA recombinase